MWKYSLVLVSVNSFKKNNFIIKYLAITPDGGYSFNKNMPHLVLLSLGEI
ncbi:hypothetical protein NIES2100_61190 [Calothrix sp. NIES-2100]|nr:hypothetical protein NIES2100_61190 [Calothrix sp. NIES-2100]